MTRHHYLAPCPDCHIWHCAVCGCVRMTRQEMAVMAPVITFDVPQVEPVTVEPTVSDALDVA